MTSRPKREPLEARREELNIASLEVSCKEKETNRRVDNGGYFEGDLMDLVDSME